ncbi:hypothetical protein RCF34_14920 [Pseudomonas sp. 102515]|uniref:hypothetical protein n=1 Tax=Pseudomonas sp. 102515 TaxID=3071568 RepID=UPI002800BD68|nr:hypothetical protein [Pseudomonas sp. 102515]MDQ7914403.1 hypothetical protein [Pseudomonas sp. 102515]
MQDAKQEGAAHYEHYRDTAADQLGAIAQSAQAAADELEDKDTLGLAHYVSDMARSLTGLAEDLRGKSAEQLLHQAGTLARDNPALFLTGSIAIGFGLSRFLKASSQPDTGHDSRIGGTNEMPSPTTPSVAAENELVEPAAGADVIHTNNIPKGPDLHTPTTTGSGDPIGGAAINPARTGSSLNTGTSSSHLDRPTLSGDKQP